MLNNYDNMLPCLLNTYIYIHITVASDDYEFYYKYVKCVNHYPKKKKKN